MESNALGGGEHLFCFMSCVRLHNSTQEHKATKHTDPGIPKQSPQALQCFAVCINIYSGISQYEFSERNPLLIPKSKLHF